MNWLKQIRDQLTAVWNRSNNPTRAAFVAVAVGCLILITAVGIWASRPQYVPLAVDLTPEQTGEIVNKLNAAKIDHKLNYSGSTILVPNRDFNRARPLVSGIVLQANQPRSEAKTTILDDPRDRERRERELSEQQLAQAIMQLDAIKYANVKIGEIPSNEFFSHHNKPKTASVIIEIHPDFTFTRSGAFAVVKLVAGGVPGLETENVTVVDTRGRILSQDASEGSNLADTYLDATRKQELKIYAKLHDILRATLGEGASAISVNVELNPEVRTLDTRTFDAETGAKTSETVKSRETTGASRANGGKPGTESNLSTVTPSKDGPFSETTEELDTKYQPGEKHEVLREFLGKVKRMSIAATVDLSGAKDAPREQIEDLIKNASGFDEQRGDKLTLFVGKIASVAPVSDELEAGPPWWDGYERLARSLSLGVAAVVALVIGLLVIRRLRPVTVVQAVDEPDAAERRQRLLSDLSSKARENPEAVSRILATWLNDPGRNPAAAEQADALEQPRRRAA